MGQFSDPVAAHPRTNEDEVLPPRILTTQESVTKVNLQMVQFFSVHSMSLNVDFWKADEKTISVIYWFAYFPFAVFFMCTII